MASPADVEAMLHEASIQGGGLLVRAMVLAGQKKALEQQVAQLEAELAELKKKAESCPE